MSTTVEQPAAPAYVNIHSYNAASGKNEPLPVMAEASSTPGLYVTPEFHGPRLTGFFHVTHGPSGMRLPIGEYGGVDASTARRIADALGQVAVDWTADKDTIVAALGGEGVPAAVKAAVTAGKYPPVEPDQDGKKPLGPADWPETEAQATAQQVIGSTVHAALNRYADNWTLVKYDTDDAHGRALYVMNAGAMIAEYGMAYLLRTLHALDPDAADAAARDFWEAVHAGDSFGEFLSEWGRQLGIETPDSEDREVPTFTLPPALSFEQVLDAPLAYPDHGTIRTLRQQMAILAYKGQERYGQLADKLTGDTKMTAAENDEFMIAHGCSFYGWALLSVLSWLATEYPHLAVRAARMVDDIGTNGGAPYTEDIPYPGREDAEPDVDPGEETEAAVMAEVLADENEAAAGGPDLGRDLDDEDDNADSPSR